MQRTLQIHEIPFGNLCFGRQNSFGYDPQHKPPLAELLTFLIRLTCWKKMTPSENDPYLESLQTEKGSGPFHLIFHS